MGPSLSSFDSEIKVENDVQSLLDNVMVTVSVGFANSKIKVNIQNEKHSPEFVAKTFNAITLASRYDKNQTGVYISSNDVNEFEMGLQTVRQGSCLLFLFYNNTKAEFELSSTIIELLQSNFGIQLDSTFLLPVGGYRYVLGYHKISGSLMSTQVAFDVGNRCRVKLVKRETLSSELFSLYF